MNFDVDLKMLREGRKTHSPVEAGYFHDDLLVRVFYMSKVEERRRSTVHSTSGLCRRLSHFGHECVDCLLASASAVFHLKRNPNYNSGPICKLWWHQHNKAN
jgi:hypothetical protein